MTDTEVYFLLFTDVLVSNFAFNISYEIIFDSMKIFESYDIKLMIAVSMIAYSISIFINYLLGNVSRNILAPSDKEEKPNISFMEYVKNFKFLPIIIALSAIPFFGKFIIFFLGMCRVNLRQLFFIAISTKLIYYVFLS